MNPENNNNLAPEQILDAIKSGHVKMRPKWHFILKAILIAVGGSLLGLTVLYLVSFIFFILRHTGVWFVPIFGLRGWYEFLFSLPWLLIALALIFIIILELLVRHYAFAYRRPLLYSSLAIVLVVVVGGLVVASTPFHRSLFEDAEQDRLPLAGPIYRQFGRQAFQQIHPGLITATTSTGFLITDRRGRLLQIVLTPRTRLPFGEDFAIGDVIVVFGPEDNKMVQAFGIQEIDE